MSGILSTPDKYYVSYRIQIAAELSGFQLKVQSPKADVDPYSPVSFESSSGDKLFEPNAIASFVANEKLNGGPDKSAVAEVIQWSCWADKQILPPMTTWVYPYLGVFAKPAQQKMDAAKESIREALSVLNRHLETRTFLVGERLTLADITVACDLLLLFQHVLEPKYREAFPHVQRWFTTVLNQPASLKVLGVTEVQICAEEPHFDVKNFRNLHPQSHNQRQRRGSHRKSSGNYHSDADHHNQGNAPAAAHQVQNQHQPKQAKQGGGGKKPAAPKEKPAAAPADDAEEEDEKPKESKDPFAALPKGKMDMDEWKRTFSNNDIESVAMPWLWEHFDAEHYSIWFADYLYNDELKQIFMTCNLVGGMFQRLDKMRKHAFGSMCVFGENNKNSISGVWMWRGKGLAFELDSDLQLDHKYYDWKQLDHNNPEHRKLITDYFIQRGEARGQKFNQGKIFK